MNQEKENNDNSDNVAGVKGKELGGEGAEREGLK